MATAIRPRCHRLLSSRAADTLQSHHLRSSCQHPVLQPPTTAPFTSSSSSTSPSSRRPATSPPSPHSLQCALRRRSYATAPPIQRNRVHRSDPDVEEANVAPMMQPRWAVTPPAAVMAWRLRPSRQPTNPLTANRDPELLDAAYRKALGRDGDKMLEEEVKWLAVTHKSFDQGRRGFNDRLAYLGKRIVELQASIAILGSRGSKPAQADEHGRMPYQHDALAGLQHLNEDVKRQLLDKRRIRQLAEEWDLDKVTRWQPRNADNLHTSGVDVVLSLSVFAIIGAVALQKGGEAANEIVRERVLPRLGMN